MTEQESVRNEELLSIISEAYQVVGVLADRCGLFDNQTVTKIMDNLSEGRMVHTDVLPFAFPAVADPDDAPELSDADLARGTWHVAGQEVTPEQARDAISTRVGETIPADTLQKVASVANGHYWDLHALIYACEVILKKMDDDEENILELRSLTSMAGMKALEMQSCFDPYVLRKEAT